MTCGIYKIENKLNEKVYIGQSINIERRWKDHIKAIYSCKDEYDYPLYRAIRLYGIENFEWIIIEKCNKEELDNKEKYYIKQYNSITPYGYNQTFGGQDNFTHSMKLSYDKIQEIKTALKNTDETGRSLANRFGVSKDTITSINVGRSWYEDEMDYPIRKIIPKKEKVIKEKKSRKNVEWPSKEELKNLIRKFSFVKIGNLFSVTDNAVRKWCDYYGLPRRKSDINKISDEEWEKL